MTASPIRLQHSEGETMRKFPFIGIALAAVLSTVACGAARADNFTFSFSNDPEWGNVDGTVTGEIFGLPFNGTAPATDVQITSYPAGLVKSGSYPTPIDVFSWTGGIAYNSFTVNDGTITGGG